MQPIICLSGPTAAGKTALAMALFDALDCELISVDSTLVYRGLNIGTAKPSASELTRYPHHLIDICDPAEVYSASQFQQDARALIQDILARGKTPLLVGGTMLYFRALLAGLNDLPAAQPTLRAGIEARAADVGWAALHAELAAIDPTSAARIHPNDPQRLTRALEVYQQTGQTLTELTATREPGLPNPSWQLVVAPTDRKLLHERIALRFDQMLDQGLIDEVRGLRERGDLHLDLPAIRAVGYRQVWQYLAGDYDFATMRERGIIATRQLAKRQITWLRSWPGTCWLDPAHPDLTRQALRHLETEPLPAVVWQKNRV